MLHELCYIELSGLLGDLMAKGDSGRVVIEVDPALKRELYATLDHEGLTLKGWFVRRANEYIADYVQPSLAFATSEDDKVRS
jgi:hypothetical protein